jgi:carboxymethylenebutenolidase
MAYTLVLPDGTPPIGGWPGVVVLFEAHGMTPEMLAVGDRFADRRWAAYLPDFLSPAGGWAASSARGARWSGAGPVR